MNYIKSGNTTVTFDVIERLKVIKNLEGAVIGIKDELGHFVFTTPELKHIQRSRRQRLARKAKDEVYASSGMTKVRGALGGTYYE